MDDLKKNIRRRKGFSFTDFYQLLGVSRDASSEEIKKAYRKKALHLHPDRNNTVDAGQQFKLLVEAYETLIDEGKRRRYDVWLEHGISFTLIRVWQQAKDHHRRYRTAGFRRNKKPSPQERKPRRTENLGWLANFMLVTMIILSVYTIYVSVTDYTVNGFKTSQVQGLTFSGAFMALLLYIGLEKKKRRN